MNKTPFLNYAIAETEIEAENACNQWIGGGFYQLRDDGKFNCFSMAEFQRKIANGEFDS